MKIPPAPAVSALVLLPLLSALWGCQGEVDPDRHRLAPGLRAERVWAPRVERDLSAIQTEGVLRLIVFPGAPSYLLLGGEETGFEYELTALFAREWNLRLEVVAPRPGEDPFTLLNEGRGDLVAGGFGISNDLKRRGDLTCAYARAAEYVVLAAGDTAITDVDDLDGLVLHVPAHAPARDRLVRLRDARKLDLHVVAPRHRYGQEALLRMIAEGEIRATVADGLSLSAAQQVIPGLRRGPALTEERGLCWVIRRNSPDLKAALDRFLRRHYRPGPDGPRRSRAYGVLAERYFEDPPQVRYYRQDALRPDRSGRLSPWDGIIRAAAAEHGLDWILAAALIFEESRFDPLASSHAGAVGLMQILPRFAEADSAALYDPETNIRAGVAHLADIHRSYDYIAPDDRWYFTLATYHAGFGHMNDARRLAMDAELNPNTWHGNVEVGLKRKRERVHYPSARHGYYRGDMSVRYAESILHRVEVYRLFLERWTPPTGQGAAGAVRVDYQ